VIKSFFRFRFPFNLVRVYVFLSLLVLVPTVFSIAYVRVLKQGRESRRRIEEIEKADSYRSKLIHAVAELERRMKDQVTGFIDAQTGPISQEEPSKGKEEGGWWVPCSWRREGEHAPSPELSSETLSIAETDSKSEGRCVSRWYSQKKPQMDTPVLLDVQREMVERLNKLSGLKKERAFYDDTRNSHASIVCREDRGFNPNDVDSTLRHWADRFVF